MPKTSLLKKLRIQPGQHIMFMNPPDGYFEKLGDLPERVQIVEKSAAELDFVQLFVMNIADLEEFAPAAIKSIRHDGLLWICYPKKSSKVETDISRDVGWEIMAENGFRPVTQVSIDETWSALRFRPADQVGK
jgi:hypothetical protein